MKIYKERHHSLMLKPFAMLGKQYLGLSVFLYFDLTAPASLLPEQKLWREVPPQLGGGGVLDMGMPKSHAEYLVYGACHAARDTQVQASKVTVRIGKLEKTLYVFGERYWNRMGAISDPKPFSALPLTYAQAYGGPEYPQNPLGMGFKTRQDFGNDKLRTPLPHVELPKQLIGSLDYHPQPASFQPIDVMWPQRHKKSGSYDASWLKQRWPDMPDDTHPTFFNTAASDQWQEAWFAGDEPVDISHMHPDMQQISSRLPGKRIRAFLTMYQNFSYFKKKEELRTEFREVETHLDTVLLFPEILRGVLVYRGSVESSDDEYYDVARAFIQTEELADAPKSLEFYQEALRKRLAPSSPVDLAPFEAAGKELSRSLLKLRNLPKELDRVGKSILGKDPVMPRSPGELTAMSQEHIAGQLKTLDELEAVAKDLHAGFGHKSHIDLKQFESRRRQLLQRKADILKLGRAAEASRNDLLARDKQLVAGADTRVSDAYSPEKLQKVGLTMEQAREAGVPYEGLDFSDDSGDPFHDRGFPLVVQARKRLEADPDALAQLTRLGLERETIDRAWLGLLPEGRTEQLAEWGLEADSLEADNQEAGSPDTQDFRIPRGLLMPRFDAAVLNRVMVRTNPRELSGTEEDALLPGTQEGPAEENPTPGSDTTPLALYPAVEETHWIRVADELQALYVEQELGDACGVISLATPGEKPDADTEQAIKAAGVFLCLMPQGTKADSPGWKAWAKAFPNARLLALPQGETVFQTALAGHDVRKLVLEALPEPFSKAHSLEFAFSTKAGDPAVKLPDLAFPKVDIGAKIDDWHQKAASSFTPTIQKLSEQFEKSQAELDTLSQKGGGFPSVKAAGAPEDVGTRHKLDSFREIIADTKSGLLSTGLLSPEKAAAFDKADVKLAAMGKQFESLESKALRLQAQLGKLKPQLDNIVATNTIPGMTSEEMSAAGLDPAKGRPLTRAQVIEMLEQGRSFIERNFKGTDLSELDMSGVDMSKSLLIGANLKETRLDNACFERTIFQKSDLTKASLRGASLQKTLFQDCKLQQADCSGAQLNKVCCTQSDLTDASLSGSSIRLTALHNCMLRNTDCSDASLQLTVLQDSDAGGILFRNARMQKGMIKDCCLDKADFSGAAVNRVMFHGTKGKEVRFVGADMSHGRMAGNTELPGADFQGACLDASSLRETSLSGASFKNATLNQALFELCDLTRAGLRLVKAHGARLLKTDFEGADMAGMDLLMGSLRKSRLVDTDLTAANLYGVDLYKSVMHNTKLDRANLKRTLLHRREEYIG